MSGIHIWVMPGESASSGGQTFFTVHKSELVTLLNEHFLPYTAKVTEEKLQLTELANTKTADTHPQTFSDFAVEQSLDVTAITTSTAA